MSKVWVNFQIEKETLKELDKINEEKAINRSQLMRKWIKEYIKKESK